MPYALKHLIDVIIQPGRLFTYNEQGIPVGLVQDRQMVIVTSRGGDYSEASPLHALDHQVPYLRTVFSFVGITDIGVISAQPMDISPGLRATPWPRPSTRHRSKAGSTSQTLRTEPPEPGTASAGAPPGDRRPVKDAAPRPTADQTVTHRVAPMTPARRRGATLELGARRQPAERADIFERLGAVSVAAGAHTPTRDIPARIALLPVRPQTRYLRQKWMFLCHSEACPRVPCL